MGSHTDSDFITSTGNPIGCIWAGRYNPSRGPRPVRTDCGQFFRGKCYPWIELRHIGRKQNQPLSPVSLFDCQYPLDGLCILWIAAQAKNGFRWIGNHATLSDDLSCGAKVKRGRAHVKRHHAPLFWGGRFFGWGLFSGCWLFC